MKKKYKLTDKEYTILLEALLKQVDNTPKLKPDRDIWDIEGSWQECGDIYFIDSKYMPEFAIWRDFSCKTVKLINYGQPAVRMSFFSKHKYWLKKPHDLTPEEQDEYIADYLANLTLTIAQLRDKIEHLPPILQNETYQKIYTAQQEIEAWQHIRSQSERFELAVSTYQRGYAYLYISYKYLLPKGEYDNATEHLLHHTRDRIGNITQTKQNIIFVETREINRVHPQQNKEIENYLSRFTLKSTSGSKRIYARVRADSGGLESFEQGNQPPANPQLDLFNQ